MPIIKMADIYAQPSQSPDIAAKLRDMEEKQRLLKDRILLIGQTLVEEREKTFKEIREMKKSMLLMKEDSSRIKELLERVTEQLNNVARKEEVAIVQRQLDLIRK